MFHRRQPSSCSSGTMSTGTTGTAGTGEFRGGDHLQLERSGEARIQEINDKKSTTSAENELYQPPVICNRFECLSTNLRKNVFYAGDKQTKKVVVLRLMAQTEGKYLQRELQVYESLLDRSKRDWNALRTTKGISVPRIIIKGKDNVQITAIYFATSFGGSSLEEHHRKKKDDPNCGITLSFLCRMAYKGIELLKILHQEGYLHRDVHPGNFLLSKNEVVSLIDFKSAGHFKPTQQHEFVKGRGRKGSLRSFVTADEKERTYCPKDDLEALAVMLVNLKREIFPWNTEGYRKCKSSAERQKFIGENHLKDAVSFSQALPRVFQEFLHEFTDHADSNCEPDYDHWIRRFQSTEKLIVP